MPGKCTSIFTVLILLLQARGWSQAAPPVPEALKPVKDIKIYKAVVKTNAAAAMADVKKSVPGLLLDLRYATGSNFTHRKLYPPLSTTYLLLPAARALDSIETELHTQGLGLKIFDAYRPYSVTRTMWDLIRDERYVADPAKGSGHNRGAAVDLTIVELATNRELNMGTGFDNFSDTAHHTFTQLPADVLKNRLLLRSLMERHGFAALETEWWHYSLSNAKDFRLLDLSFRQMRNAVSH